jgi:transcription elongation factor GreA
MKYTQKIAPIPFTEDGYKQLLKEKEALLARRPGIVDELRRAREMGDLSENGMYKGARMSLSSLDSRIRHLTHLIRYAVIIEEKKDGTVRLGCIVVLKQDTKEITYAIVGEHESDSLNGKISAKSPLGKAMIGKKIGDTILFHAPKGEITYYITDIK